MSQKIGVAIIHGIGNQVEDFYKPCEIRLRQAFARYMMQASAHPDQELVIEGVHWAGVLEKEEEHLLEVVNQNIKLRFPTSRSFLAYFMGDAIAYQPSLYRRDIYDAVHHIYARTLQKIAEKAGENAPLCIIAHSLGTIITSNYLYDLQQHAKNPEKSFINPAIQDLLDSPLEKGYTLNLLYTMGSPIAIWSLRYEDFGDPIDFPPPQLKEYYPKLFHEWVNLYDTDDAIAFPISTLNKKYGDGRVKDRMVNVGNWRQFWNPTSHMGYWLDADVIDPIAFSLARTWREVNL